MKTEKVFFVIILIGLLFKFMYWPFAGPLLVLSIGTLSMLYLGGGFYFFSDKNIEKRNVTLSVLSGIVLSIACIGTLFKLMFWPFTHVLLSAGILSITVLWIVTFILKSGATVDLKTYYHNMIIRVSIVAVFVWIFYVISTSTIIKMVHSNDPELARLKIQYFADLENKEKEKAYLEYRERAKSK